MNNAYKRQYTCYLSQFEAEYIRLIGSFTCVICLILRQNTNNNQPLRVIKMQWLAHCIISCQRNLSQNAPNYTNVVMNKSIDNVWQTTNISNKLTNENNKQQSTTEWRLIWSHVINDVSWQCYTCRPKCYLTIFVLIYVHSFVHRNWYMIYLRRNSLCIGALHVGTTWGLSLSVIILLYYILCIEVESKK